MQLVLGVAVSDSVARIALVDAADPDVVVDRFEVALGAGSTRELVRTIVDTDKVLPADGHHLAATGICWADETRAAKLRDALGRAGMDNVSVVPAATAATAFVRTTAITAGEDTSALLLVDGTTAALSVVGLDAATTSLIDAETLATAGSDAACDAMLERLREETGGARTLYVIGTSGDATALTDRLRPSAPLPMHAAAEPAYALARGAASAVRPDSGTAQGVVVGQHLAYSMAPDSGSFPIGIAEQYDTGASAQMSMPPIGGPSTSPNYALDPNEIEDGTAGGRPRVLLIGSTVAAMIVVGFAVLAVGVAVAFKPTASEQAVRDTEAVPGKYLPPMPGQGIEPVEEPSAYLPPVVPVSAEPPATRSVVQAGSSGGGGTGGYTTNAGSVGAQGPVPAGVDPGVAPNSGNPGVVNPLQGFKLSDWIPDLPDNVTINLGRTSGAFDCDLNDPICQIKVFDCLLSRPGALKCLEQHDTVTYTKDKEDSQPQPPTGCLIPGIAASCAPTEPGQGSNSTEDGVDPVSDDPETGGDGRESSGVERNTGGTTDDSGTSGGTSEGTNGGSRDEGTTSEPEVGSQGDEPGGEPPTPADGPSTPKFAPPSPHESADEPVTTKVTPPSPPKSSDEPVTTKATPPSPPKSSDEPITTKATPPSPPKSSDEPITTKASPPSPVSEPRPVSTPAPAPPPPPPPVVEAPAPAPPPVVRAPAPPPVVEAPAPPPVVEAPAPAPQPVVEAPAPPPVVEAPAPVESSGSGSGSSSSSGGSGSSSSSSAPTTTVAVSP